MSSLEFTNLPLEEVACRAGFDVIEPISLPQYVKIWQSMHEHFPDIRELSLPYVGDTPSVLHISNGIPGITLLSNTGDIQLDIQSGLIVAKWNNVSLKSYPRYAKLRDAFIECCNIVRDSCLLERDSINFVNMAYIHTILPIAEKTMDRHISALIVPGYLPTSINGEFLNDYNLSWRVDGQLDHRIIFQKSQVEMSKYVSGQIVSDPVDAVSFMTITGIHVEEWSNVFEATERVHNEEQSLFLSMITEEAKELWGYVELN